MRSPLLPALLALALVLPSGAAAQVDEGDRVRVSTRPGREWTGRVAEVGDSALVLERAVNGWGIPVRVGPIALDSIRRLDVSARRHSRAEGALRGAAIGVGAGAVGGAVSWGALAALQRCDPHSPDEEERFLCFTTREALVMGTILGGFLGIQAGAVVGFLAPGDHWVRVPVRPVVVAGSAGGVGIGVSVAF